MDSSKSPLACTFVTAAHSEAENLSRIDVRNRNCTISTGRAFSISCKYKLIGRADPESLEMNSFRSAVELNLVQAMMRRIAGQPSVFAYRALTSRISS